METVQVPAATFTGTVHLKMLFQAEEPFRTSGGLVTFAPGARTDWHTHPYGQAIIVVSGTCRLQEAGGPVHQLKEGDVAFFPAGVKHWHGAAPDSEMSHLAITETRDGSAADWMEKVTDSEYNG